MDQRNSDEIYRREIPSFIEPRAPLISNPFMRPRPQKGTNLLELFEDDLDCDEPELVKVYLRLKPCNIPSNLYEVKSDKCLITSLDSVTVGHGRKTQHNVSKKYTFSHIFGPDAKQKELFERIVKDNLKKLLDGHSFTLLTYGASGSGKTFTLMGTVAAPGLVPRSLEYVFRMVDAAQRPLHKPVDNETEKLSYAAQEHELQFVKQLRQVSTSLRDKYRRMSVQLHNDLSSDLDISNRTKYYVWVSFVEIYNEAIYDLLTNYDRKAAKLVIREDSSGNVYVKGATQVFVRSGEEAYDVMVAGKQNLQVAATGVNLHSSRSHCIFTITMLTESGMGCRMSSVRLCDLAGCERARRTRNAGTRLAESRAINSSLHVLERCLRTLRTRQRAGRDALIPYRESKLTRLLGSGLSGARGEAVSVVVTLNPAPECAHETRHVLQLAAVANKIQVNNTASEYSSLENISQDTIISNSSEVLKLRVENERLHFELLQAQACYNKLLASMEEKQAEMANTMKELVDEAKDMTREYYETLLQSLRDEMKEMKEEYEAKINEMAAQAPAHGTTPLRNLHNKVSQLMMERAILEEKLTAETLARARVDEELQHLRVCIEETDEKVNEDEQGAKEFICLTDSEGESEDDEDPCNESLEPTFKKEEINRSRIIRQSIVERSRCISINKEMFTDEDVDTSDELNNTKERINGTLGRSNDLLKDEDPTETTNEDTYTSVIEDNSRRENEIHAGGDGESDQCDTKENDLKTFDINRGTYFITEPETVLSCSKTIKEKLPLRGTYFVRTSQDDSITNEITQNESENPAKESDETNQGCGNVTEENNVPAIMSESLVSKLLKSVQRNSSSQNPNTSLAQFEQLEMATNEMDLVKRKPFDAFNTIRFNKSNKKYFGDNSTNTLKERTSLESGAKKVYFDNLDPSDGKNMRHLKNDDVRSPSVVKDFDDDYQPSKIVEIFTRLDTFCTEKQTKVLNNKRNSCDPFSDETGEELILTNNKSDLIKKPDDVENIRKSISDIVLTNGEIDIEPELVQDEAVFKQPAAAKPRDTYTDTSKMDDTTDAFENIYKEISHPRATEFDMLLSMEMSSTQEDKNASRQEAAEAKYNLRKKKVDGLFYKRNDVKLDDSEEILLENVAKCESSGRIKRSLRLKTRKGMAECTAQRKEKLKDIVNLQEEFSDVTMDVPAPKKLVRDIPSPVKLEEVENRPPHPGVQSCPSKSVTRSRRKLFTPRAEPLEESPAGPGDSGERVRVPRPSYHRPRARRKL